MPPSLKDDIPPPHQSFWFSTRSGMVFFCFTAIFLLLILRFNFSMALVCMVHPEWDEDDESSNNNESSSSSSNNNNSNSSTFVTHHHEKEFRWDKSTTNFLLGGFFLGYMCLQILGGWLSDQFGSKLGLTLGMGATVLCTLLLPVCARTTYWLVWLLRLVQGVFTGLALPSLYSTLGRWSGSDERATIMSFSFAAMPLAAALNYPITSALCEADGGWPNVFYWQGGVAAIWLILFVTLSHDNPQTHPRISAEERAYLQYHSPDSGQKVGLCAVPWSLMLSSRAVRALIATHFCSAWGFYLANNNMPSYAAEVFKYDLKSARNGLMSALPNALMFLLFPTAFLFDWLRRRRRISLLVLRKTFNTVAFLAPSACFLAIVFLEDTGFTSLLLISVGLGVHELALTGGFFFSHRDVVGGGFSGLLFGLTNTVAQIAGFVSPMLITALTPNKTRSEWNRVFLVASLVSLSGALVYLAFGSVEREPWAKIEKKEEEEEEKAQLNADVKA